MGFFRKAGERVKSGIQSAIDKSQEQKREEAAIRATPEFQAKRKAAMSEALLKRDTGMIRERYKFTPGQKRSGGYGMLDSMASGAMSTMNTPKGKSQGGFGMGDISALLASDMGGKPFQPGFQRPHPKAKKQEKKKRKTIVIHV